MVQTANAGQKSAPAATAGALLSCRAEPDLAEAAAGELVLAADLLRPDEVGRLDAALQQLDLAASEKCNCLNVLAPSLTSAGVSKRKES